MTDPIADMLTRIRNALVVKHEEVEIPTSNMKKEIARILLEEGYINGFEVVGDKGETIKVALKYGPRGEMVISGLKRISKPVLLNFCNIHCGCVYQINAKTSPPTFCFLASLSVITSITAFFACSAVTFKKAILICIRIQSIVTPCSL